MQQSLSKVSDIDKIIKLVLKNKYDSAVIISKAKQHPYKALKIIGNTKNIWSLSEPIKE